jgi:Heparinase II/III-like protein/Heparinase II/III N-terminus
VTRRRPDVFMSAPAAAKARRIAGAVRSHPLRVGLAASEKVLISCKMHHLRRSYTRRVTSAPANASLRPPTVELVAASQLPPELGEGASRIVAEARRVLGHEVDYLGSGMLQLGAEIDWHQDFKSGYRWPRCFYQDVEVTRLDDSSDAKVPWELSRGHHLLTLARAARLHEDDNFAVEFEAQLASWLQENPPGYGINWVNAMEVAIRAVNWIWSIGTLEGFRPLERVLRESVTRSLQVHGRHIAWNLEGGVMLRNNHYLADVLGLLAIGAYIDGDGVARKWFRFAQREFERQIMNQVLRDGVSFEASMPYHGLALEMFLLGWLISQTAGKPLSQRYRAQLVRMLAVSSAIRHPDGRSPQFGDQDSGRVLPAGFARPTTHDHLLDIGSAVLQLPRSIPQETVHEEVAWTAGIDAWRSLAQENRPADRPRNAFTAGGVYVLRSPELHVVVRWGDVGQNGKGGHGHNDLSSFELSYGLPFVVDPGTYVYTADAVARNAFRSARAHNVVVVDGLEMHPISPDAPFAMPSHASFGVEARQESAETAMLIGWHDGYSRLGSRVICRRSLKLDKRTNLLEVIDEVRGQGTRPIESLLHLAPGCTARRVSPSGVDVHRSGRQLRIVFTGSDTLSIEDGWISERYGVREACPVVRAVTEGQLPMQMSYEVMSA